MIYLFFQLTWCAGIVAKECFSLTSIIGLTVCESISIAPICHASAVL
jgi:hypothetical protein